MSPFLSRLDRKQLYRTFREAFADYLVDVSRATEEAKRVRAIKNKVDWDLSVGVFDGRRMVAFTMIAVDDWKGEPAAFDVATGVVPAFRGRGLAASMFEHALPELRRRGVRRLLLEVLQKNEPAIRAYRKAGFSITRELGCFDLEIAGARLAVGPGDLEIRPVEAAVAAGFADQLDWHPSWENSLAGVGRVPDLLALGAYRGDDCLGAIAFTPTLNLILTLVVRRDERLRGVGSALLRGLLDRRPGRMPTVRVLNVDASDRGMLLFLARCGFHHVIDQYEMERVL